MLRTLVCKIAWRKRFRIMHAYEGIEGLSPEEIGQLRLEKLNRLLNHYQGVSFYAQLASGTQLPLRSLNDMTSLPVMTKKVLRENEAAIREKAPKAHRHSTSGSTGVNFWFYIDDNARDHHGAFGLFVNKQLGLKLGHKSMGIWGGNVKKREENELVKKLKTYLTNTTVLPGYGLNAELSLQYIDLINQEKPDVLYGYPSYLAKISEEGLRAGKVSNFSGILISSGEQLHAHQREQIERFFKMRLYNRYGSVEFSTIGHELPNREGAVVNPLQFILETDEKGKMLVTDLNNYATPFIRYDIGDRGVISYDKNFISIQELLGRSNDLIYTPSGRMIPSQFWTILSRRAEAIRAFQIKQLTPILLEMRVIAPLDTDYSPLINDFNANFGDEMELRIRNTDDFETTPYGKLKFVIGLER